MSERLLIVDDDVDICFLLSGYFNGLGYETEYSFLGEGGLKLLREKKFDAVLCDYRLPDRDGFEMLKAIRKEHPTLPVIIITGYSDVKTAVNVIKYGAFDYVTKPILPEEILQKVKEAIADRGSEEECVEDAVTGEKSFQPVKKPKAKKTPNGYVQGVSTAACKLEEMISLVGPTNMTVIVQGETGSGKENVARSLHNASPRKGKPFLALDCGALPDDLAASELFGHKKGSFTGAIADKDGFFVHADGGTLFLDEIGNLSYDIQVQLLRVIQERKVRRMGETSHRDIDVRLVVATNEDLKAAAEEGSFREDLYHRLNEFFIEVPPLRKRGEDILLFADFFLRKSNEELSKDVKAFDEKAKALVQEYDWPGNLRELQNVIKRAVLLCSDAEIGTKHFPMEVVNALQGADQDLEVNDLKSAAEKAEYEMILKALKEAKYNKGKAAKALGVDRKTLYNKMKQFNIS